MLQIKALVFFSEPSWPLALPLPPPHSLWLPGVMASRYVRDVGMWHVIGLMAQDSAQGFLQEAGLN